MQLARRVLEANPKTVIVLLNGGPVSLVAGFGGGQGSRDLDAPAVVDMFWAGEEGGNAIADVLFGDYNPGAKLPYTVYRSVRDLPPMTEYDITKGFTYMYFDGKPQYAFGHGLSYTTFSYSNLRLSSEQVPGNGQIKVRADVENSGKRAGDEVVQLYVHQGSSTVRRPREQLAGLERRTLGPGERRPLTFALPLERRARWHPRLQRVVVAS